MMENNKRKSKRLKKKLLIGTLSIGIILMLIIFVKLALSTTPINVLANIRNYISTVFSDEKNIGRKSRRKIRKYR